ncbi:MAG TPA: glucosyl-3-phosphoglycerate synthase [Solirubrobacteraceae bacterium]|nr:glucosyl-3-phosphoglycerate synthase [Solirubrobacteraceae bacterium]
MSVMTAERWASARSFHHSLYPAGRIAAERRERVSVCLPARECADTVGEIVGVLAGLRDAGAIDEIVVVDAASADGTAALAERAGARVLQEAELVASHGPVLGKGDAMWRALPSLDGELVCFVDADTEGFSEHFVTGLLGPLVCEPQAAEVSFVKGFYRRPLGGAGSDRQGGVPEGGSREGGAEPTREGGGRVNHLTARPALALFYPELAGVRQPLAGEVAARRELLERLPFVTGYGVEVAMLIDAWRAVGLEGMAQVDLDEHRNRHQPLSALSGMALTVLATIARRLEQDGRLIVGGGLDGDGDGGETAGVAAPVERPPLVGVGAGRKGASGVARVAG